MRECRGSHGRFSAPSSKAHQVYLPQPPAGPSLVTLTDPTLPYLPKVLYRKAAGRTELTSRSQSMVTPPLNFDIVHTHTNNSCAARPEQVRL